MTPMLDCLVSYRGLDEELRAEFRQDLCYHIHARPGPLAGTGVAVITKVRGHDETERTALSENCHVVETGGPGAALAAAVRYLDGYHDSGPPVERKE
jgi:hypothetical protein